jgi:hypothetical protein
LNLEKAVAFVRNTGNEVEQARLRYILANEHPTPQVVAQLFAEQRPDGGWSPLWAKDYSSLDATCFRLAQAEQMGLTESDPAVIRAVHFLAQRQSPEGSWEEDKSVANDAPAWAKPGDLSAKFYLTANCGFWLALLGNSNMESVKAADYLQTHLHKDGYMPGFLHTHWLAGGLWKKLSRQEPAERMFEYLGKRINDLAVSNLSWLITTAIAAGVTPNHPLIIIATSLLEEGQQTNGGWLSEDGAIQDVHSTLEALRALGLCGRITES